MTTSLGKAALSALAALTLSASLAACGAATETKAGSDAQPQSAAPTPSPSESQEPQAEVAGTYIGYDKYKADPSAYSDTKVVLFFHATWCPSCQSADAALVTDGVPEGITVVKVDYDTMTDLKKKYGVTVQHTFVAVDANGAKLKIWSGAKSGKEIAEKLA